MRSAESGRKYELSLKARVPRLAGEGVTQEAPAERTLETVYYDTKDFRLTRAGIALRRNSGTGWSLKLPSQELRFPLGDSPKAPAQIATLLRAYTLDRKLRPVAQLRTDRFTHRLTDASGRTLATLADDHVTGEFLGGPAVRLDRWRELDVEAGPELLDRLDRTLRKRGAENAWWPSKLQRLMGDAAENKRGSNEVLPAYLRAQFERLRRADLGFRVGEDDSVHQLRVAARKLRSALQTFASLVGRKKADAVTAELKWLGAELAPARDAEVSQARLEACLDEVSPELVFGPLRQYLTRDFARTSRTELARATEALSSNRYAALLRSIAALLDTMRPAGKKALRKPLRKTARKLCRATAATEGLSGVELEKALHNVRKKAKRARYAADAVRPAFGKKLRAWRKHVKAVQQTLGKHQDSVVDRAALRHFAIDGFSENQNTFTFGLLYGRDEAAAKMLQGRFADEWRTLRKGARPSWLKV
ncbi:MULTISPECIES: CYTH and CHAD domain-containing protein [Amycolatopsis]|uniref:CYTH and CHAD domain-containing protein n=1 Tax=Amycolatopsis dendrobii TaxID=2760662 RepID=A0A7W3ZCU1_9PSEU|nr:MULTISPECIES: CYTH and CHAD domain-containing protein [Amycolatopsis]MBB1156179.1 CYTH and CHAD domain-containing protein [Amycolatopsis dendrobii]UKD58707.1 CYTH and CHAD domain-containing protein [Amycolatopsis sp. FU40]